MAEFVLNGVVLDLPPELLTRQIDRAIRTGRYENTEALALMRHIRGRDRLLDLGAGAGYLATLAGRIVAPGAVTAVEAAPELVRIARATLARNGVEGRVIHAAVVPAGHVGATATLALRPSFWASSLIPPAPGKAWAPVEVPAIPLPDLLAQVAPTVMTVDLEGGEAALFDAPLSRGLRLAVVELHPAVYGRAGIGRIFAGLMAAGFAYQPQGSQGNTVVFDRGPAP